MHEDVTAEWAVISHVFEAQRTVDVSHPFGNVASHVVETKVVRPIGTDGRRHGGTVIEVAGYTHVVAGANLEVGHKAATILFIVGAKTVTVPRIDLALGNDLVVGVANQADSGIFPFCFRGQTIGGQQDAIRHVDVTDPFAILFAEVLLAVLHVADILSSEISVRIEVLFILLVGVPIQDTGLDEHQLIHTVGTPSAIVVGLNPADTYYGIVIIGRMSEIDLNHWLVVSQSATPYQSVGHGIADHHGIVLAVNTVKPINILAVIHIADLCTVQIERRYRDLTWHIIPTICEVVSGSTHNKGAAFNGNQARADLLLVDGCHLETAVLGVVVGPTGGS